MAEDGGLQERLGRIVADLLHEQVAAPRRREELLSDAYLACLEAVRSDGGAAASDEALARRLAPIVARVAGAPDREGAGTSLRSGAWNTFVSPDLRAAGTPEPAGDAATTPEQRVSVSAFEQAVARAQRDDDRTLLRYLGWLLERNRGRSYESIAADAGYRPAGVRTGVRRARVEVRRLAQAIRRAANAPHQGRCPPELARARDAWRSRDLGALGRELERTRPALSAHPYWIYLAALHADDTGDRETALELFERVLVCDDDPSMRAKVLNCLGYIADDGDDREAALELWSRSVALDPLHLPAHVNLLKNACDRRDPLDVLVCMDRIGELLSSQRLRPEEKEYLVMRLEEHPDFTWARTLDAWAKGPQRWIARARRARAARRAAAGAARAGAAALGVLAAVLLSACAPDAAAPRATSPAPIPAAHRAPSAPISVAGSGDRGGMRDDGDRKGSRRGVLPISGPVPARRVLSV